MSHKSDESITIVSLAGFSPEHLERIREVSPWLNVRQLDVNDLDESVLAEAEVLYTANPRNMPLDAMPRVRWIQLHFAGSDGIDHTPLVDRGITVTNASGIHAVQIAEYVLGSMLAWSHHFPRVWDLQRQRVWPSHGEENLQARELRGATVGILGYGSIGREVARLCQAFGLRVLAMRRDTNSREDKGFISPGTGDPEGRIPAAWYAPAQRREMLAECDYVVVTLPLTPDTHHFIGRDELQAMRPHAYLVNIGRGAVIDEDALVDALENGVIGGAGLDVFTTEPLPPESPLWKLNNVILSPHISGSSDRYADRACELFVENLRRYLADEPLLNVIDWERGY